MSLIFDSLVRGRASERNLALAARAPPGPDLPSCSADIRDAEALAAAAGGGQRGVPSRRAGGGDDQPGRRRSTISPSTSRGTFDLLEALRRRATHGAAASSPAPTRSMATWPTSRWSAPTTPTCRATRRCAARGIARGPAARLPHALWLLQGRGGPIRARLRPQLRRADRGAAHELHLRPAPDGHRGSGLGRAFPAAGAGGRADQHLRRRPPGARHPATSTTRSTPTSLPGDASTRCRGRAFNLGGGPAQRGQPACSCSPHIEAARGPSRCDRVRRLAAGRPALLRVGHARARARQLGLRRPFAWRTASRACCDWLRGRARACRPGRAPTAGEAPGMKVALVNPPWSFENSIYFGCREPHLPLELGYCRGAAGGGRARRS